MTNPANKRPNWDDYFLGIALSVAARADCTRSRVGAVLADTSNRIRGAGYNGSPPGGPSCLAGECPRGLHSKSEIPPGSSYDTSEGSCIAIHAELNLMLYTSPEECRNGRVYITRKPCDACLRILSGAGLAAVIWPGGKWSRWADK